MIVFEKEQVANTQKKPTASGLTSGLRATLQKGQAETERKEAAKAAAAAKVTTAGEPKVGTGGTSITMEARVIDATTERQHEDIVSNSLFSCKVFFPNGRHVIVNVTEDVSISGFLKAVLVQSVSNPQKFRNIQVSLYAADAHGEMDEDCPVLDDRRPINQFGISSFVFKSTDEQEFAKVELNQNVVNIGPAPQNGLADPLARLLRAAESGYLDDVRKLIEDKVVHVSAPGIDNWTALHYAARQGHLAVVNFLIKQSANIDAVTKSGWSPLHLCAYTGQVEVADIILTCGADPNLTDYKGKTPLDYANQQKRDEMIDLLEEFIEEEKMYAVDRKES